jgi:hypothetical protein
MAPCYRAEMASRSRIWTAQEMETMSPDERDAIVRAGFQTDLANVSPELLERARIKVRAHIEANEGTTRARP